MVNGLTFISMVLVNEFLMTVNEALLLFYQYTFIEEVIDQIEWTNEKFFIQQLILLNRLM